MMCVIAKISERNVWQSHKSFIGITAIIKIYFIIYIYISKELINSELDYYYPIIKILGDNIKEH